MLHTTRWYLQTYWRVHLTNKKCSLHKDRKTNLFLVLKSYHMLLWFHHSSGLKASKFISRNRCLASINYSMLLPLDKWSNTEINKRASNQPLSVVTNTHYTRWNSLWHFTCYLIESLANRYHANFTENLGRDLLVGFSGWKHFDPIKWYAIRYAYTEHE